MKFLHHVLSWNIFRWQYCLPPSNSCSRESSCISKHISSQLPAINLHTELIFLSNWYLGTFKNTYCFSSWWVCHWIRVHFHFSVWWQQFFTASAQPIFFFLSLFHFLEYTFTNTGTLLADHTAQNKCWNIINCNGEGFVKCL